MLASLLVHRQVGLDHRNGNESRIALTRLQRFNPIYHVVQRFDAPHQDEIDSQKFLLADYDARMFECLCARGTSLKIVEYFSWLAGTLPPLPLLVVVYVPSGTPRTLAARAFLRERMCASPQKEKGFGP